MRSKLSKSAGIVGLIERKGPILVFFDIFTIFCNFCYNLKILKVFYGFYEYKSVKMISDTKFAVLMHQKLAFGSF